MLNVSFSGAGAKKSTHTCTTCHLAAWPTPTSVNYAGSRGQQGGPKIAWFLMADKMYVSKRESSTVFNLASTLLSLTH
jgi:hypothetical protein